VVTRTRVLVAMLLAALVLAAIAGPAHVGTIVLIVLGFFVAIVCLGVVIGVRDGLVGGGHDATRDRGEPPPRNR
jgi:hypothetical protein